MVQEENMKQLRPEDKDDTWRLEDKKQEDT